MQKTGVSRFISFRPACRILAEMSERTLIIIKPDGVQRRLIGNVISRFEEQGLKIIAAKFTKISIETAQEHYFAHRGKYFFDRAVKYLCDSPVLLLILQGTDAVQTCREMVGATFASDAATGTIRGDYGAVGTNYNIVHGSDSVESAAHEINLYFKDDEIFDYKIEEEKWLA